MIGHSVASTDGLRERRNERGGRILHLDTGPAARAGACPMSMCRWAEDRVPDAGPRSRNLRR